MRRIFNTNIEQSIVLQAFFALRCGEKIWPHLRVSVRFFDQSRYWLSMTWIALYQHLTFQTHGRFFRNVSLHGGFYSIAVILLMYGPVLSCPAFSVKEQCF